ncbi:MAG: glycerate kinase [Lautropia sp.]
MNTANAAIELTPYAGTITPLPDHARSGNHPPVVLLTSMGLDEALEVREFTTAITEEIHATMPSARVLHAPVIGGSEGFTRGLMRILRGTIEQVTSTGPHGEQVRVSLGLAGPSDRRIGVFEINEAHDLRQMPPESRDPTSASSRGVGQLISAALDRGVSRLIIGCGDSGANDGGIGMAAALGVRFLDARRTEIVEAGGLQRLASIDMSKRDPRLDHVWIEAVVNPADDLIGENGVTRVHGPRKGASAAQVLRLERGLATFATIIQRQLGFDVAALRGGDASGGLGAGLVAFAGATLIPRLAFEQQALGLDASLAAADVLIATGESPAWLARRAADRGVAVVTLEPGARTIKRLRAEGLRAILSALSAADWQTIRT